MESTFEIYWPQVLLLAVEIVVVTFGVLSAFYSRRWVGIAMLCVLLGVLQPIQVLFLSTFFLEVMPGVMLSPGSVVLFSAGLVAVMLVYLREDAAVVRSVIYSLVAANLLASAIFLALDAQLPFAASELENVISALSREAFDLFGGTILLGIDVLLVMLVYEQLGRFMVRGGFWRIYLTLTGVLVLDTVGFTLIAFSDSPQYIDTMVTNALGKAVVAIPYSGLLMLYLRYVEPIDLKLGATATQNLRDVFAALSYRQRYELQRAVAENALDQVATLHIDLLEATTDALIALDANACIIDTNKRVESLLDQSSQQLIGQRLVDLIQSPDIERELAHPSAQWATSLRQLTDATVAPLEATYRAANHSLRHLEIWITPVETIHGPVRALLAMRDVSERRQLFEQRLHATRMESLGRLAGGVAHDFNNLLMVILSAATLADPDEQDERTRNHLRMILQAAERGGRLTRQLLAFARTEAMTPTVVDLNDMLVDLQELLERVCGHEIQLEFDLAPDVAPVLISKDQLEQGIINLVSNARDAIPDQGTVRISTAQVTRKSSQPSNPPEIFSCVTVSDNGTGIEADHLAHIFDPFFTTKSVGEGTGLGLSMALGIAEQSGGKLEVESELGKGSSFLILLPETQLTAAPVSTETASTLEVHTAGRSVLVVDDNRDVADLVRLMLASAGYQCRVAHTARLALDEIQDRTEFPDLLITDIVMPDMRGDQLVQLVRSQAPNIAVVFMTGHATGIATTMTSLAGHPLLHKPFQEAELLSVVGTLLESQQDVDAPGKI